MEGLCFQWNSGSKRRLFRRCRKKPERMSHGTLCSLLGIIVIVGFLGETTGSHIMTSESKEVEFEMIHNHKDESEERVKKKEQAGVVDVPNESDNNEENGLRSKAKGHHKTQEGIGGGPGPIVEPDVITTLDIGSLDPDQQEFTPLSEETIRELDEKTSRLKKIEELSTGLISEQCVHEFEMMRDVKLSTEFANVIMEKVDMIVSFLYKLKKYESRIKNKKEVERDEQEVYKYVLETVKEAYSLKDVRLLIHNGRSSEQFLFTLGHHSNPEDNERSSAVKSNPFLFLGDDPKRPTQELLIKSRVKVSDLEKQPWYLNPNAEFDHTKFMGYGDSPVPKSSYHQNKLMDGGMNGGSYWTWPYFNCSTAKNQKILSESDLIIRSRSEPENDLDNLRGHNHIPLSPIRKNSWLASYTAWFPIKSKDRVIEEYGELSLDLDISSFEINPCGFSTEQERDKDMIANPLYYFRDSHKCDRVRGTSVCHFIPGNPWRLGSYECKCKRNKYAYNTSLNNTIAGGIAEAAWSTMRENKTNGEDSVMYQDIVACKECPDGCEDCVDGVSCLAPSSLVFRIVLLSVSVICSFGSLALILVTYKYRKKPVLKSSSPLFHGITLCGCVIMYSEMIALFPILSEATCIAVKWTRHLGFCVTYTALYMKLCRVFLTFRVKSAHKIKLTEKHLLHWMSPVMVVMLLYLFAWTISDPPSIEPMFTTDDLKFFQCVYNWWDHSLAIGEVIFLGYGVWICWRIRENPDAQFISYSIYNIAFTNVIMVTFHLLLVPQAGPDTKYLLAFVRTQLSTTVTIALVFGSKLLSVLRGDPKALKDIPTSANGFGHETLDLEEENQHLKEELTKMATQIEKLKSYAMCKNNPHLKQSSGNVNVTTDADHNKLDSYAAL